MRPYAYGVDPMRLSRAAHALVNFDYPQALELQVLNRWYADCHPYGGQWDADTAFALVHFACTTPDPWDPTCARQMHPDITDEQHAAYGAAILAAWLADPTGGGVIDATPGLAAGHGVAE